jgi:hypothetical protein
MNTRSTTNKYNLDIQSYSLDELFQLFDFTVNDNITLDQIKQAKRKVLMMHPDKSNLPSEYFLFYKKAFELVIRTYDSQQKTSVIVPDEKIDYVPELTVDASNRNKKQIQNKINELSSTKSFQKQFNELFEQNQNKPLSDKNDWFKTQEPLYEMENIKSTQHMGKTMAQIKQKQKQDGIIQYTGVVSLYSNGGGTRSNFYDDVETDEDTANAEYITCDPFSKLKFDDLRKVHKDQTVFAVNETDFEQVKQYKNVDEYVRTRNQHTPMEQSKAQLFLQQQEKELRERMLRKQHQSQLKTMEYEQKNKNIMSNFLRIQEK